MFMDTRIVGGRKIFKFRGKTMEELLPLSVGEFSELLTSRGRRTLKRGFDKKFMKKIDRATEQKNSGKFPKPIRTHLRNAIVIPKMVGLRFAIHRGNTFEIIEVREKMLGHYLGELTLTRKRLLHGKAGIGATRSSTAITARK